MSYIEFKYTISNFNASSDHLELKFEMIILMIEIYIFLEEVLLLTHIYVIVLLLNIIMMLV